MNCQDRVFPSWNRRGGCASKKKARSLRSGADGVVIMVNVDVVTLSGTDHPVCAFIRRLRSIFLMAQPPLLSEEGNTLSCNSFTPSMPPGVLLIPGNTGGHRPPLQFLNLSFQPVLPRSLLWMKAAVNAAAHAIKAGTAAAQKTCLAWPPPESSAPPKLGPMIEPIRPMPRAHPTPVERIAVG